jgi:hypothetical protein
MSQVFDAALNVNGKDVFSGFFITEQSYSNILEIADLYFKMGPEKKLMQLVDNPHMFITSNMHKIKTGIGKSASLRVSHLGYNAFNRSLIAVVQLKNNFTDRQVPIIKLSEASAKTTAPSAAGLTSTAPLTLTAPDKVAAAVLTSAEPNYTIIKLHNPYTVYGKIGMFINEVPSEVSTPQIARPEITLTVDNSPPPGKEEQEEPEMFLGYQVHKGNRGGKFYYTSDGKKRYITDETIAKSKKKDVVYNINFLAPPKT